jgi:subtilisin family serine protease
MFGRAISISLFFLCFIFVALAQAAWFDSALETEIVKASDETPIAALIFLTEQVDLDAVVFESQRNGWDLSQRHYEVVTRLQDLAGSTQLGLRTILAHAKKARLVDSFQSFWIVNAFAISAKPAFFEQLRSEKSVHSIYLNQPVELIAPVRIGAKSGSFDSKGTENGIASTRAPELWAMGFDGTGTLACDQDSGADGTHPAFASRWRGLNPGVTPEQAWFDPNYQETFPTDSFSGHGTHTMGTMVGGDDGANQIGMAPGAKWIGAKTVGLLTGSLISDPIAGFQWAADPDGDPATMDDVPDVINNSWGMMQSMFGQCLNWWNTPIKAAEAAGIVVIFAAGNEGPFIQTMRSPANQINSTLSVFSVGFLNQDGATVNYASSRGPSDCDSSTLKPEVVTIGNNIRSASPGGGYQLMSGSSMAAPHVSGAVLLLRDAFPDAPPEEIKMALYATAVDLGPAGEDIDYGRGRIDLVEAYNYLLSGFPAQYCIKMDEFCDMFWIDYNPAIGAILGFSDECTFGQTTGYPVFFKFLPIGWGFYLNFDSQAWPPDCNDGDFGLATGSGGTGTLNQYIGCTLDGPDTIHLRSCY